ncbi:MAG: ATP-binding cassette domain-containing protein [Planctomycetaceae bacterium]
MSEAPLFQLRDVRRQYGETLAVDVDEFAVRPGETLCLLGPTGAGKSTLLRLLAGIERPTSGEIRFREAAFDAETLPLVVRRRITLVFQRPALLTDTVRANVEYGLRVRHGRRQLRAAVDRVLERLGLSRFATQAAQTLSGGQIQLVALARALVLEPEVLLLDEPTAHLDPAHVALVERVIREEFRQRSVSIVWATHNLFQARRVAQRVALLLSGRLVESASTEDFFESPTDPRTKDFVDGKMIY